MNPLRLLCDRLREERARRLEKVDVRFVREPWRERLDRSIPVT